MDDSFAPSPSETASYRYWAYITHSTGDLHHARRLRRRLEAYGVPTDLRGTTTPRGATAPARFKPVALRAETAPQTGDALASSRWLIVICSPAAANDASVAEDIERFRNRHGDSAVVAFIVSGDPHAGDGTECFPQAFRATEPLAADARSVGDGYQVAVLKILAGMLGVRLDSLRRRDQQRRQQWAIRIAAGSVLVLLTMTGVAAWAIATRATAVAARNRSERQLAGFLEIMQAHLLPLQQQSIMDRLATAVSRYEAGSREAITSFDELKNRVTAHTTLGDTASMHGSFHEATHEFEKAAKITKQGIQRWPEHRALSYQMLCTLERRIADVANAQGDTLAARAALDLAMAANATATQLAPAEEKNAIDHGICATMLAAYATASGRPLLAIDTAQEALERLGRLLPSTPRSEEAAETLARCHQHIGLARVQLQDYAAAQLSFTDARGACQQLLSLPSKPTRLLRLYSAVSRQKGDVEAMLGRIEPARALFKESFEIDLGLSQNDPENLDKFQQAMTAGLSLARFDATHGWIKEANETHDAWNSVLAANLAGYRKQPASHQLHPWWMTAANGYHAIGETELRLLGSCAKAIAAFEESVRIRREVLASGRTLPGLAASLCDSLSGLAMALQENGDIEAAMRIVDEVVATASERVDNDENPESRTNWRIMHSDAIAVRGVLMMSLGDVASSTTTLNQAQTERERLEAEGTPTALPLVLVRIAEGHLAKGSTEEAATAIAHAEQLIAERSPDQWLRASAMAALLSSDLSMRSGRHDEAAAVATAGLEAIDRTPAAATTRDTIVLRAQLHAARGQAVAQAGKPVKGVRMCTVALDMLDNIMGTDVLTPREEIVKSKVIAARARCLQATDKRAALKDIRNAVRILEPLVAAHPARYDWALRLCESRLLLAALTLPDDRASAFRVAQDNTEALRRLVALHPQHADAAQALIRALRLNVSTLKAAGQDDDATAAQDEALVLIATLRKAGAELDCDIEQISK
jgi:tetratricopeptide (TPR) repeat protein